MAQITKLAQLINGILANQAIDANELVVDSLTVGGTSGTNLTKTQLDTLISQSHASQSDNQNIVAGNGLSGGGSGATVNLAVTASDASISVGAGGVSVAKDSAGAIGLSGTGIKVNTDDVGIEHSSNALRLKDSGVTTAKLANNAVDSTKLASDPSVDANRAVSTDHIKDSAVTNAKVASGLDAAKIGSGTVSNTEFGYLDGVTSAIQTQLSAKQDTSEKGQANGYASLDGAGKVPIAQLPNSIMEYKGTWNASTNTPTLADGTGNTGDVYRVTVAGTQNLGSGSITFAVGEYAIYNNSGTWEKSGATDGVTTVNGASGAVTVNAINQLTGDVTTTAASGSQSKAATVAAIAGTTVSGTTGSGNVVFSASPTLTGTLSATTISASGNVTGANLSGTNTGDQTITLTGDVTGSGTGSFATTIANDAVTTAKILNANVTLAKLASDSVDENKIKSSSHDATLTGGSGSVLSVASAPLMKKSMVAGESMAANTSFLVRWALTGETAGRVYKADSGSAVSLGKFWAYGMALKTSLVNAGDSVDVICMGTHVLGSSDLAFSSGDVGKPVWLTTSGAFSTTAPTSSGTAAYKVGMVENTDRIWMGDKQLSGIN